MKPTTTRVRLLLATAAFGCLATFAQAGPGAGYWKNLNRPDQFVLVKPGAKVAYVCNECKTVSEIPVTSKEQLMDYCKEGSTVTCPSCKKHTKVVHKPAGKSPTAHTEVTYVNKDGKECAFFAAKK